MRRWKVGPVRTIAHATEGIKPCYLPSRCRCHLRITIFLYFFHFISHYEAHRNESDCVRSHLFDICHINKVINLLSACDKDEFEQHHRVLFLSSFFELCDAALMSQTKCRWIRVVGSFEGEHKQTSKQTYKVLQNYKQYDRSVLFELLER